MWKSIHQLRNWWRHCQPPHPWPHDLTFHILAKWRLETSIPRNIRTIHFQNRWPLWAIEKIEQWVTNSSRQKRCNSTLCFHMQAMHVRRDFLQCLLWIHQNVTHLYTRSSDSDDDTARSCLGFEECFSFIQEFQVEGQELLSQLRVIIATFFACYFSSITNWGAHIKWLIIMTFF